MKKILPVFILIAVCVSLVTFIVLSDKPTAQEEVAAPSAGSTDGSMKIVVLDVQHLLNNSAAAESIKTQAIKLTEDFEKELQALDKELREKHKKVIEDNKNKSNEDKIKAREKFEEELKKANEKANDRREKVAKAVNTATQDLRNKILEIVAKIAPTEGYDLILTRQDVVIVSTDYDITNFIMDKLNKELDSVDLKVE